MNNYNQNKTNSCKATICFILIDKEKEMGYSLRLEAAGFVKRNWYAKEKLV